MSQITDLFVVCEHHEYSDVNCVVGIFPDREAAEKAIRCRGEVFCWKENFMPFALVWAQVKMSLPQEEVRGWMWIEHHTLQPGIGSVRPIMTFHE